MAETTNSADNDKMLAAVSSIPIVGLIIHFAMKDASPYVKNYARQGGVVFFIWLALVLVGVVTTPILGLGLLVLCVNVIFSIVTFLMLIINALQGNQTYKLPVIGDLAEKYLK